MAAAVVFVLVLVAAWASYPPRSVGDALAYVVLAGFGAGVVLVLGLGLRAWAAVRDGLTGRR